MGIKVLRPGLLTTLQDLGRIGFQQHGVMVSGAMDSFALRIANLLVGNEEGEATLEITWTGPELRFDTPAFVAICGARLSPTINGFPVREWSPVYIEKGSILRFGKPHFGCRAYLAVAGGFDVPLVMESKSTSLRVGIGGYKGRALQAGDWLPLSSKVNELKAMGRVRRSRGFWQENWWISQGLLPYSNHPVLRVIRGKEYAWFSEESRQLFFHTVYQISPQSDRMGYRLRGKALKLKQQRELISEAVTMGTIQVPADGQPIILMADSQTIGGYPKIAHVASVDLPVLAQMKPGDHISFREISLAEAQTLYRLWEQRIRMIKKVIQLRKRGIGDGSS